jgi:PAS domain S-box-containing protein
MENSDLILDEQKNAINNVQESEHLFHEMVHSSPTLIAILHGEDFIISMANDAILEQWGKGKDVIGQPFLTVLPELDQQGFGKLLRNVYTTGKPYYAHEMPINLERNGVTTLSYYNFIYQAQRNIDKEICGVAIIATDVKAQALLHLQLKESEERFRNLSDNVPMFIFIIEPNEEATISFWNKTWLDYTGQSFDEAIGNAWNGIIHADDLPGVMDVYVPAFKNREAYLLPSIRVKRYDGEYRWYQIKANPRYLPNGEFIGYIGTGFDVHEQKIKEDELKESEAKLRSLIEKAPVPICILKGEDMRLDLANELVLKIWNVGREAMGKPFLEIVPEMAGQPFMALLLDVYHTGVTHTGNEVPAFFINENGEKVDYFFNFVYQPSYQADGKITGVMVRSTDVTEQVIARNLNKQIYDTQARELEEKVLERTVALNIANEELQRKNKEIAFSKYNKIFLTEFSEKFSGNNAQKEFFTSLVKFISDITKLDYAFVAKFKDQGTDKFTLETIAVSELGKLIENFDYSLIDGPCKEVIYGSLHKYPAATNTIFPKAQVVLKFNVEGYIGVPLYNANGNAIGLLAVMHSTKIEDDETVNSILKITAKRTELEFERIANEENLTSNNTMLEEKNILLAESNKLLLQKNKEIEQANEKLLNDYARSLIEASHDPLVTISTDGKIMDMNEAMVEVTDKSREFLKDTDFKNYFSDKEKAKAVYQQVFAKGFVNNYPLTMVDGKYTDVLFNGSIYKDAKGEVQGAVVVARDVTEQKKMENKLLKTQERLNGGLKIANIALSEISYITNTVQLSPESAAMYGFPKNKLEATRQQMHDTFHPSIKAALEAQIIIAMNPDSGGYMALEHPIVLPSGEVRWLKVNKQFYYDHSTQPTKPVYSILVSQDITEQKKSSQYARKLIEASLDPLVTISAAGKILDVNEASIKVTGVSRQELIDTDFSNYFTEPKKAQEGYLQVFEKGFVADYPLTIKHKNGNLTDVLYNASVYKDDKGEVLGVFAAARDVTEQKRNARELTEAMVFAEMATAIAEEAKGKAEDAAKSKQQFLSNMSHEIRTPMNAIIGFTKVVLKTELTPKQKEYISAIKMSGDALIVLINDILDIAKVDAGKMTFEKVPFKLALSVDAMLHLFETKILEKNLTLIKDYDKNIPAVLMGDSIRLHQIILNLVSNALKFTEYGSITVAVKLVGEDADKVTVEFSITDTGIGIKEEKLQSIFENFTQATAITSRLYGGSGLGLAIVKQLVDLQGGNVTVKSTVDEGSTFSFILNFDKTDTEEIIEPEIMELDDTVKDIKILVVEDMPLNQLLMKTLLDDFGFESDITANGKLALEKLATRTYDIILMDLQMPEMNGFEATEYIRNTLKSTIPIVALTADVTTVDVAKCKAVGMNDYIAKPVDERLLYSKIVSLVKKSVVIVSKELLIEAIEEQQIIKCIDLNYLNTRTKSNPALMMQMMQIYLEQTPPLITLMTKSFAEKDWHNLDAAVHKMIPSFAIMGMHKDYEAMAKKIQQYAATKQEEGEMQDLVMQLENILGQSCRELEIEFNNIKNKNK